MRRKIFIVNEHLAVGVAGAAMYASQFADDLGEEFRNRTDLRYTEVTDYLDEYASSKRGQEILAEIGTLILVEGTDRSGSLTKGLSSHGNILSNIFGKVIAIGTGSATIAEQVQRLDNSYSYGWSQPSDGDARFPEFGTLARNLMLLANLYWREFTEPSSVFDAWGGAYDLIYQGSDRIFRHLNDYSIFLRLFDADRPEQGIRPMNVLKYERRSNVSLIAMLSDEKIEFFGAKDITADNAPVQITFEGGQLDMNSKIHISIIAVGKGEKMLSPIIQIDGLEDTAETKQTVFTRFEEDGRLAIAFESQHDEWLEEQAMDYYQRNVAKF